MYRETLQTTRNFPSARVSNPPLICPCDVIAMGYTTRKKHNPPVDSNMDFLTAGVYDDPGQV